MANIFGYQDKPTPIHRLNAVAKLVYFLLATLTIMLTYDIRLISLIAVVALLALPLAQVEWRKVRFVVKVMIFFSVLNLVTIFLLAPEYGVTLYGTRHVLAQWGPYTVTLEQLFYELNILVKYFATVPLVVLFILTMNPSDLAASFNRIGLPYQISYAIALTLRYIPDVQRDYANIRNAQAARGVALDGGKESLPKRLRKTLGMVMPLILMSFARIDTISQAMRLRRFGRGKRRTWYVSRPMKPVDVLVIGLALVWLLAYVILLVVNGGRFYNPFR